MLFLAHFYFTFNHFSIFDVEEIIRSFIFLFFDFFFWLLDFFLLFFNFRWLCSLFVSSETIQETHDASFCHLYVALSNKMFHVKHLLYQYIKLQLNYVFLL